MQQAELVPRIHPFTANAALTAVLLTCTLGSASDPASASYLLTDITPQWRAFAHAASAALERPRAHSSGRVVLPFSCAGVCQYRQAPVTVHRMAYYKHKPKILCFFHRLLYTISPCFARASAVFSFIPRYAKALPETGEGPLQPPSISRYRAPHSLAPVRRGGALRRRRRGPGR